MISLEIHTTSHTVCEALRLLEDLLQHEVRIATLFYLSEIDVHRLHLQLLFFAKDTHHMQTLAALDDSNITVFEIHHLIGILHNRTGVGTDKELVLTDTHHQRTLFAGSHNLIGIPLVEHSDGVGTNHLIERHLNGLQQRKVLLHHHILNELHQHLGIRIALELHVLGLQFLFDIGIVLDDAIVDDGQIMRLRIVGMCIAR